jgi:hypothetical protein
MRAHKTAGVVVVLLAGTFLLAAGCGVVGGKGTEGTCSTYAGCGGDPKGNWTLATGCQNLVVMPYQMPSLPEQLAQPQTPTQAPPQPMPTTSGDWCSGLIYQPSIDPSMPVKGVILWHGPPTVDNGYLKMNTNGTYSAEIQFITPEHTFFDNSCLTRYETTAPTCAKLGMDLAAFEQSQPGFMFGDLGMVCTGDSSVGCDCQYRYQVQGVEMGTWSVDPAKPSSIVFASTKSTEPQSATFCANGDTLQLSGDDGTNLFGALGVRSGEFTRTAP